MVTAQQPLPQTLILDPGANLTTSKDSAAEFDKQAQKLEHPHDTRSDPPQDVARYDISTRLHYTRISDPETVDPASSVAAASAASAAALLGSGTMTGTAAGPMIWGHTAFEADSEELVPVTVRDIRSCAERGDGASAGGDDADGGFGFELDRHGFQIVRHTSQLSLREFADRTVVKGKYYPEIERILKRATGASLVKITHHVLRRSHVSNPDSLRQTRPITQVHVDSCDDRIRMTIRAMFSAEDSRRIFDRRYAMVNVWRPLKRCRRDPLAFCDGSTVSDECFVPREIVMPGTAQRQVNTGVARGDGGHRWYYLRDQEPDEVILLKCWDSKEGVVKRCPHTSVPTPNDGSWKRAEDRESIELRCLLFWPD